MNNKEDQNQTAWEMWFVSSCIIFLCYTFVGTIQGSKEVFPNWIVFYIISIINLIACVIVGTKKH